MNNNSRRPHSIKQVASVHFVTGPGFASGMLPRAAASALAKSRGGVAAGQCVNLAGPRIINEARRAGADLAWAFAEV